MNKFLKFIKREEASSEGGDGGGGAEKTWRDDLPEDIRDDKALADYKDVAGMAKSLIESQRMIGRSVRVPGEDAGDEDWNKFYKGLEEKAPGLMRKPDLTDDAAVGQILSSIGKPENAKDYELTTDLDGFEVGIERIDALKTMALEANLTKAQFNKMAGSILLGDKQQFEQSTTNVNDSRTALMKEWGQAFDDRNALAIAAIKKMGFPQQLITQAEAGTVGSETLKSFYNIATAIGSEGLNIAGQTGGSSDKITPDEANIKIQEIVDNPAYWDSSHRNNKSLRAKMTELQRTAHPDA